MAASEYELCLQVGEQIRQRRVQLKMNQSELAERADVARNTVYRIEAGQPGCKMGYLLRSFLNIQGFRLKKLKS